MRLLPPALGLALAFAAAPVAAQSSAELPPTIVVADRLPSVLEFPDLPYPEAAARRREAGTAHVALEIDAGGNTSGFSIERSSGSPRLDAYALELAKRTKFQPATLDGENVSARVVYPVTFELRSRDPRATVRLAAN